MKNVRNGRNPIRGITYVAKILFEDKIPGEAFHNIIYGDRVDCKCALYFAILSKYAKNACLLFQQTHKARY